MDRLGNEPIFVMDLTYPQLKTGSRRCQQSHTLTWKPRGFHVPDAAYHDLLLHRRANRDNYLAYDGIKPVFFQTHKVIPMRFWLIHQIWFAQFVYKTEFIHLSQIDSCFVALFRKILNPTRVVIPTLPIFVLAAWMTIVWHPSHCANLVIAYKYSAPRFFSCSSQIIPILSPCLQYASKCTLAAFVIL